MISLNNVTKIYTLNKENSVTAVRDVTLKIEPGEFVVITGRSGSGKTTLLNLVAGLTRPTSGEVRVDGVALWDMSDKEQSSLRNEKMGFVFQFPSLLPSLTSLENVVLPVVFGTKRVPVGEDVRRRAVELLQTVRLGDKMRAYPRQLSAGQQQRVVIARSLIGHPELLLADEPTSDLDEQTEQEIMDLFQTIHSRTGVTIVMVTHTSQLVNYGTRAIQMAGGAIVDNPAAQAFYAVKAHSMGGQLA